MTKRTDEAHESYYFWCQTRGPASLETGATTIIDGERVVAATGTAGSVTVLASVVAGYDIAPYAVNTDRVIGFALETVTATEFGLVDLNLE